MIELKALARAAYEAVNLYRRAVGRVPLNFLGLPQAKQVELYRATGALMVGAELAEVPATDAQEGKIFQAFVGAFPLESVSGLAAWAPVGVVAKKEEITDGTDSETDFTDPDTGRPLKAPGGEEGEKNQIPLTPPFSKGDAGEGGEGAGGEATQGELLAPVAEGKAKKDKGK